MELELDFQYVVDHEYDGYHDCEAYGCDEEGICRCYTIENAWVEKVDINHVEDYILDKVKKTIGKAQIRENAINSILGDIDLSRYFVNRLLRLYKAYDKESWEVGWCGDYYGETVDFVQLYHQDKLIKDLHMMYGPAQDLIFYVLEKEYGHVPEKLISKKWKAEIVPMDKVVFPQKEHYNSIHTGLHYYSDSNYQLPRGIVVEDQGYYRVIDGYHRLKNTSLDVAEVIVGY